MSLNFYLIVYFSFFSMLIILVLFFREILKREKEIRTLDEQMHLLGQIIDKQRKENDDLRKQSGLRP